MKMKQPQRQGKGNKELKCSYRRNVHFDGDLSDVVARLVGEVARPHSHNFRRSRESDQLPDQRSLRHVRPEFLWAIRSAVRKTHLEGVLRDQTQQSFTISSDQGLERVSVDFFGLDGKRLNTVKWSGWYSPWC